MAWPWQSTRPDVGLNTRAMTVNSVVLPTPFGPMIPSISPTVTCTDSNPYKGQTVVVDGGWTAR